MTLDLLPLKELMKQALREVLAEEKAASAAPTATPDSALLTTAQVAARCGGVDPETVLGWIHSGKLPASRPGHVYLVDPEDLKRFLAGQKRGAKLAVADDAQLSKVLTRMTARRR